MDPEALTAAIAAYFRGERHEMYAILGGALGLVLVAAALHLAGRDGFSRGFGITSLLVALALSAMAVSLLRRDPPHEARLLARVRGAEARAAVAEEAARLDGVVARYPTYRHAALGLAVAALAAAALSRAGWVAGAACGVLLLAAAQLAVDHYSEARAVRYAAGLRASPSALP